VYIVAFTKFLRSMKYTWAHPLHYSPLSPLLPFLE
jgi:hypothetical protein